MPSYNDTMNKITKDSQSKGRPSTYNVINCTAYGCPLGVTVRHGATVANCQYHERVDSDRLQKVTHRINQNIRWVKGYAEMATWSTEAWTRHIPSLTNNEFLPMKKHEPPSMYMARYHAHLHHTITRRV